MRAITIKQPWASAIAACAAQDLTVEPKRVENRVKPDPWRSAIGERLAIHAGKGWDRAATSFRPFLALADGSNGGVGPLIGWMIPDFHRRGQIIASGVLADVHQCDGSCSPWADPEQWHLVWEDVVLMGPTPAKGALGLWRWEDTPAKPLCPRCGDGRPCCADKRPDGTRYSHADTCETYEWSDELCPSCREIEESEHAHG